MLSINKARFHPFPSNRKSSTTCHHKMTGASFSPKPLAKKLLNTRAFRSYADVTKGILGFPPSFTQKVDPFPKPKPPTIKTSTMIFSAQQENLECLSRCAVGVVSTPETIPILEDLLIIEDILVISIKPMGSNLVQLEFDSKEIMEDHLSDPSSWLLSKFDSVTPWDPSFVEMERFVWLKCYFIPAHIWCYNFFSSQGSSFGTFV